MIVHDNGGAVAHTAHIANSADYVATQLLHDLAGLSAQAIDSVPQLKKRLLDMQCDRQLGRVRLFDRDGRIGFSLVPAHD
ncbi:hypothetical protein LZ012_05635 [Dechloromonas sp. XY25]|uniref:Uncharacterized protein n=1 Tax=Dechloromonas hankyongensis TaxID=2908002 RepID=A0ABS9K054_9RHOO|nr:hypothetical protein [Dechloromonas hankyongensis]MCG2576474.1 hypothetical protein [Dechloromonas hankyongensis]